MGNRVCCIPSPHFTWGIFIFFFIDEFAGVKFSFTFTPILENYALHLEFSPHTSHFFTLHHRVANLHHVNLTLTLLPLCSTSQLVPITSPEIIMFWCHNPEKMVKTIEKRFFKEASIFCKPIYLESPKSVLTSSISYWKNFWSSWENLNTNGRAFF